MNREPTLHSPTAGLGTKADPLEVWNLLFYKEILLTILRWSNIKIQSVRDRYKNIFKIELGDVNITELKAFFALLFHAAILTLNHEKIERIFATDGTGRDIFRCVRSKNRFAFLLICLRFDNRDDRDMRKHHDLTVAISQVFNRFVANSQNVYENVSIDKMLVGFRRKCRFKMYMPSKPCKYGLKILCMTDARNHYFFSNGYIYCGKIRMELV